MAVADRRSRFFDPGYLSLHQLAALLVVVHENGKDVFLDPGQKFLPYGQLHWAHTFTGGLLETPSSATTSVVTPANDPKQAVRARLADLILDAHGAATGSVKILMNGPSALHWRQANLAAGSQQLQTMVGELLHSALPQGITWSNPQVRGLSTSEGFVEIAAQVSGRLGQPDGQRLRLPGFFFAMQESNGLLTEQGRTQTVAMRYTGQEIDNAVFHLPAGYVVESTPQNQQLPWPGHAALVITSQSGTGMLTVKRIFAEGFVLLPPQDFPALQAFYQKVAAADQQPVVLALAAGAAGN